MELIFFTRVYDLTDDGGSADVSDTSEFTVTCASVEDAVHEILSRGCFLFSSYPELEPSTWMTTDTYKHPYSGQYEETTCHRGEGIGNAQWLEILRRVQ